MKDRATQFLQLARRGKSYSQIAELNGITKARVGQILKERYPLEMAEILSAPIHTRGKFKLKKKRPFPEFTCLDCGKKQKSKYKYYKQQFCNKECSSQYASKMWKTKK